MKTNFIYSIKKTVLTSLCFILIASTNAIAQKNDDKGQSDEERSWFWDIIKDVLHGSESWDDSDNVYDGVVMKIDLGKQWKFNIGDNDKWSSTTYNDNSWENISVPGDWENDGFHGYDGYAWYRIHFDGRSLNQKETHFLILGFIDDVDETFINGELVGSSGTFPPRYRTAYNSNRKYYIPNNQIHFYGDNTIAVRVYDEYANGGIVNGKPGIYTSHRNENLQQNLSGTWKFLKSNNQSYNSLDYDDKEWENILVPSHWDNHGYRTYDGTAWYRKTFILSFDFDNDQQYYLVLGKVDDFDETYLNGKKIGETIDNKRLGESTSYDKVRIYEIPQNLLNPVNKNILAVKVHDLGGEGGIYRGPIGIVDETDLTRIIRQR